MTATQSMTRYMTSCFSRFLKREEGRSSLEYAIMAGVLFCGIGIAVNSMTGEVEKSLSNTSTQLGNALSGEKKLDEMSYHEKRKMIVRKMKAR